MLFLCYEWIQFCCKAGLPVEQLQMCVILCFQPDLARYWYLKMNVFMGIFLSIHLEGVDNQEDRITGNVHFDVFPSSYLPRNSIMTFPQWDFQERKVLSFNNMNLNFVLLTYNITIYACILRWIQKSDLSNTIQIFKV